MIGAIVLAAGQSRRMGQPKLLLPLAGKPLIAHAVDAVLEAGVGSTLVVVSDGNREGISQALGDRRVTLVVNSQPDGDMLSSVRAGIRSLPPDCHAMLVLPGDYPGIRAPMVRHLIQAFEQSGHGIAVPVFESRRGHPLLFSSRYGPEILSQFDGIGLRGLLAAHRDDVLEVPVPDASILADIDVPADYAREQQKHHG